MLRSILATTLALAVLTAPGRADACRCVQSDVIHSYQNHDHAFLATAGGMRVIGGQHVYTFTVHRDMKTCVQPGTTIFVATADNPGACGTSFVRGTTYLLYTNDTVIGGRQVHSTSSCSYNIPAAQITRSDRDYLGSRPLMCGGRATCVDGTAPVSCLVDPCSVSPACAGSTCESNTCGGCTAEWYDPMGFGQCMPW